MLPPNRYVGYNKETREHDKFALGLWPILQ
jgi:hypothetical protein